MLKPERTKLLVISIVAAAIVVSTAVGAVILILNSNRNTSSLRWSALQPLSYPSYRKYASFTYDEESDRVILFGGLANSSGQLIYMNDTWAYDYNTNTWEEMLGGSPEGRWGSAMVYYPKLDKMVLFGGSSTSQQVLNDTWTYDYNNNECKRLDLENAPLPRTQHQMAYDPQLEGIILFGGNIPGHGASDDMWILQTQY